MDNSQIKIAVDAMGGDFAPSEIVQGTLLASQKFPETMILLVGDRAALESEIAKQSRLGGTPANIEIIHTSQSVGMSESPVEAIRNKPDSSVLKCVKLVGETRANAFISAGNTGAVVAGATILWGYLPGVKRAGIAVPIPTQNGLCYLIDAGANVACNPLHLLQYGIMASTYCRQVRQIQKPRLGILNIGEEDSKGNELVKQTYTLFNKTALNFTGNVEGPAIFKGGCDVVVCEGFVGNIFLKTVEGVAEFLTKRLVSELAQTQSVGVNEAINKLKNKTDYAEYGGASLLGLNGIAIICHGRSNARAINNAIKLAIESSRHNLNEEITRQINAVDVSWLDILRSWRTHR